MPKRRPVGHGEHSDMATQEQMKTEDGKPGSKGPQITAAITVNIVAFAYGTIMGWPATALPILQSSDTPLDVLVTDDEASWIGSLMCLGAASATPFFSYIGQRSGRKQAGYILAIPLIISWLLVIFATNLPMLYASRFVVGLGAGGILILCPLYVGEIAEDAIRGALGTFFPFFINAGILFAFIVGSYVDFMTMAIIYLMMPIAFLVGFPFLPETPLSLLSRELDEQALRSLQWLRGTKHVDEEMTRMKVTMKEMKGTSSSLTLADVLSRGSVRGIIIGVGLCTNQQLCGIFAILTYTVDIFQASGSDFSPNTATILVGVLQLGASVIALLLMDRAGRKVLLIVSNLSMAVCLASIGGFFYFKNIGANMESYGWLPVLAVSANVVAFGVGMGPVPFVMISEIFSPKVRGVATTISLLVIWLLAFAVAKLYPSLTDMLGIHGCYWLFSICCLLGTVFAVYIVPETKGRTLESILKELNGDKFYERKCTDSDFPISSV